MSDEKGTSNEGAAGGEVTAQADRALKEFLRGEHTYTIHREDLPYYGDLFRLVLEGPLNNPVRYTEKRGGAYEPENYRAAIFTLALKCCSQGLELTAEDSLTTISAPSLKMFDYKMVRMPVDLDWLRTFSDEYHKLQKEIEKGGLEALDKYALLRGTSLADL